MALHTGECRYYEHVVNMYLRYLQMPPAEKADLHSRKTFETIYLKVQLIMVVQSDGFVMYKCSCLSHCRTLLRS